MKKTLGIFAAVLIGLFVILSLIDTSHYAVEKAFWRIQKDFDQIRQDPKVVPPQQFEQLANKYRKLVERYPDSPLIPKVHLYIGTVYVFKGDYEKAKAAYQEVIDRYPESKNAAAEAMLNLGKVYELERNEEKAVAFYRRIMNEYPRTETGIIMPIYIANYYAKVGKSQKSLEALREAEGFYKNIADGEGAVDLRARRLLSTVYMAQQEWMKSIDVLKNILIDYADSGYIDEEVLMTITRSINTIALTQMDNLDLPINIYEKFIGDHPDHRFNNFLTQMIAVLSDLKRRGATVSEPS